MLFFDWAIVAVFFVILSFYAYKAKKYNLSVTDFLVANRCAKRYMLSIVTGIAALGVVGILGSYEMFYQGGFVLIWWSWPTLPIYFAIALSGWVVVRFRRTRAMTLPQFFELRYNKSFRVFAGMLSFISSLAAVGIIPGVTARFFVNFCGFPQSIPILGWEIQSFIVVMVIVIAIALLFVFLGGQIVVMVTDCLQGIFCNIMFAVLVGYCLYKFDWGVISQSLLSTSSGESLINPFEAGKVKHFNMWYFLIGVIAAVYTIQANPTTQSTKNYHEARMGNILGNWRNICQYQFLLFIPICVYVVMHHPNYSDISIKANSVLASFSNPQIRSQLTVPLVLKMILPTGLIGAFTAMMLAVCVSSLVTIIQQVGSGFIQDVILPLRKKPLENKRHLQLLKVSILGVAIYILCFSIFYQQSQYLLLYFAATGAIYLGGYGSVVIGGLYWKKGTTSAAFGSMIVGAVIAVTGIIYTYLRGDSFFDGQWFYLFSIIGSITVYIGVSMLSHAEFDLDKILHRGKYSIQSDEVEIEKTNINNKFLRMLGIGPEFSRSDKIIYFGVVGMAFFWGIVFLGGLCIHLILKIENMQWMKVWQVYVILLYVIGVFTTLWFTVGGLCDISSLFKDLKEVKRNYMDDGRVVDHRNVGEPPELDNMATDTVMVSDSEKSAKVM